MGLLRLVAGEQLAASTLEFAQRLVEGREFKQLYPKWLTAREFVDKLYDQAALVPYSGERR
jgi:hypothetical protein